MKKILSTIVLFLAVLSLQAYSGTVTTAEGYVLEFYTYGSTATITGIDKTIKAPGAEDLVIPSSVSYNSTSYTVTSIGSYVFSECSGFTGSLTLPSSITSIGSYAFRSTRFDSIRVLNPNPCAVSTNSFNENSIIYVPEGSIAAYKEHSQWKKYPLLMEKETTPLTIELKTPNTLVSEILAHASHPTKITQLTLSGTLGDDDWEILKNNCTLLYSLDLSNCTNTSIPADQFTGNDLLRNIVLPNSLTSIGSSAFSGCDGLTDSLTLPSSITSIGSGAFYSCDGFTGSLTLPSSISSIGWGAFYGCKGFTGSLTLPSSISSIVGCAFLGCSGFTGNITLPSSLTSIGSSAFGGMSNIDTIFSFALVPPTCDGDVFPNIDRETTVLAVPKGSLTAYFVAPVWGTFINIVEVESPTKKYLLSLKITGNGAVSVADESYTSNTTLEAEDGSNLRFSFSPNEGCEIDKLLLDGEDITDNINNLNYTLSNIVENHDIEVSFKETPIILTTILGEKGKLSFNVKRAQVVELMIEPMGIWEIHNITLNGEIITDLWDNDYMLTLPPLYESKTLQVTYKSSTDVQQQSDIIVYTPSPEQVAIQGADQGSTIDIFDLNGRRIHTTTAQSNTTLIPLAPNAAYIISVEGNMYKIVL